MSEYRGQSDVVEPGARVVIVGGGLMGAQIGLEYALGGYETVLVNRTTESITRALDRAGAAVQTLEREGLVSGPAAEEALGRLTAGTDLEVSCRDATLVVESIKEDFEEKVTLFKRVATLVEQTAILATNTSSLSVGALGRATGTGSRLLGTHYWNPPTLMPLVETIPGDETDPEIVARLVATLRALGKQPVIVPDMQGFVWNRLQFALLREAVALVSREGVAPSTIDLILERGLARRWSIVGPFRTMALGGISTFIRTAGQVLPYLATDVRPEEFGAVGLPDGEELEAAAVARDKALAAWLRQERSALRGSGEPMRTRAAIHHGPGTPFEVAEVEMADPGPDDVVVRMVAVGICGTDLHSVRGEWSRPTPMVLGHEGSGVIEAVGSSVDPGRIGEEVVLAWAPSCGSCSDCRRGRPAACLALHRAIGAGTLLDGTTGMSLRGATLYRGTATGALAERLVVNQRVALATGGDIPLHQAALLGCAALTGVGAVLFAARPSPGAVVLVIGAGGVGQFCIQAARIANASLVICSDPITARRTRAAEMGATHAVDPAEIPELMATVAPEGADLALDVVGNPETAACALRWTRSGGTAVIVGLPPAGARLDLDFADFNRREKWLTGTMYGSEDPAVALPILLEHVRSGQLELEAMVGPVYPLSRVNEAFEASLAGSPGRVLVSPTEGTEAARLST